MSRIVAMPDGKGDALYAAKASHLGSLHAAHLVRVSQDSPTSHDDCLARPLDGVLG
ncbi:hypothetical protein [Candidatus Accumulibacter sp. ACC003]|uniref:hypothetical protein n=1 Tax=Candidatus Accumulibacter sp. ACC003 TaxID=2823334 RepID=UPI0025C39B8D|nr:hypothetical protein [Candidatus Accumulibacter sp. ACC003]